MPDKGIRWVILGRIRGAYGVRGEIRVVPIAPAVARILPDPGAPFSLPDDWLIHQPQWWLGRNAVPDHSITPLDGKRHGTDLLIRIQGIDNREQLQKLAGTSIWMPDDRLPKPAANHHYWFRLLGMAVQAVTDAATEHPDPSPDDSALLGVVEEMMRTGSNDVLVVREPDGMERLLPFIHDTIVKVDETKKRLYVRLMPGL